MTPTQPTHTLQAGTLLYHGSELRFDAANLEGPAWFSTSAEVAQHFGKGKRLISYQLEQNVTLPLIRTRRELENLAEQHGLELGCAEEIRDSIQLTALPGWYIPDNYAPGQDDILLTDVSVLSVLDDTCPGDDDAAE